MRTLYITAFIMVFTTLLIPAGKAISSDNMDVDVEELRKQMSNKSLQDLVFSCRNATASLLILKDSEQYHRDVFDAAYQLTNVVARRRPKSLEDIKWFEQRLPFCPFRVDSGSMHLINYKASGLGFVVIEGRIYKHGINPEADSIIGGKVLKFRI